MQKQQEHGIIGGLVVKVIERCNLNCSYCYMYNHVDKSYLVRPRRMSDHTFDQLLQKLQQYRERHEGPATGITFHGGEPTLLGHLLFEKFASKARDLFGDKILLCIQTNATLVDDRWVELFRRYRVEVGVSCDGPPKINDAFRVDHRGRGSHTRMLEGLLRLKEGGVMRGVICVINPAFDGLEVYEYFRSIGVDCMDFLIPDATHDTKESLYGKYGASPVADYLIPIFDEWFEADDPRTKVRLFGNIIRVMLGGGSDSEAIGNPLQNYLVIETDGTIHVTDALKVCAEGVSDSGLNIFEHGFDDLHLGSPLLYTAVHEGFPLCTTCSLCPERGVCGGGYLAHRYSRQNEFKNPSVWCRDLLMLISHIRGRIQVADAA